MSSYGSSATRMARSSQGARPAAPAPISSICSTVGERSNRRALRHLSSRSPAAQTAHGGLHDGGHPLARGKYRPLPDRCDTLQRVYRGGRTARAPAIPGRRAAANRVRQAQELALDEPIPHGVAVADGRYRERFDIDPYTTLLYWITPSLPTVPAAPRWATATGGRAAISSSAGNRAVSHTSSRTRSHYSTGTIFPDTLLSPTPLRSRSG